MALAKSLYALPTWTRTVALVREHPALAAVIAPDGEAAVGVCLLPLHGEAPRARAPARWLHRCGGRALKSETPRSAGTWLSTPPTCPPTPTASASRPRADRERADDEFSDPDASWGHRSAVSTRKGGGFYGYRLHMAVDAATRPAAGVVGRDREDERVHDGRPAARQAVCSRIEPETCAMDKGYDTARSTTTCAERDRRPSFRYARRPPSSAGGHKPPSCEHGEWRFAGADYKRAATKWRCPTGECQPASVWIKADRLHPLIPRETLRWKGLYRGRASVEREFGRLKNEWALAPLRVRRDRACTAAR